MPIKPERIENIKQTARQMGLIPALMAYDLLTALEKAQQTITGLEEELDNMKTERNMWRSNSLDWEGEEI